jgi:hypothetical protein
MIKYSLTSTVFTGQVIVGYANKWMVYFDASQAQLSDEQYHYLIDNMPIEEDAIHAIVSKSKTLSMKVIPDDLTFERFWNEYSYKVGNIKRAEKLWNQLPEADRIKCFEAIPRYKQFLSMKPSMEKTYPETFLNQRRFENQF